VCLCVCVRVWKTRIFLKFSSAFSFCLIKFAENAAFSSFFSARPLCLAHSHILFSPLSFSCALSAFCLCACVRTCVCVWAKYLLAKKKKENLISFFSLVKLPTLLIFQAFSLLFLHFNRFRSASSSADYVHLSPKREINKC